MTTSPMKNKTQLIIENRTLCRALADLVAACTPAQLPGDVPFCGVKAPDKAVLDRARAILKTP